MARYQITGPDGGAYEITAPDDATEQDVLSYVQQQAAQQAAPAAAPKGPRGQRGGAVSNMSLKEGAESLWMGMTDPLHGAAQALSHAVPGSVEAGVNRFNNWIADNTGLLARIPGGGLDQMIQERERAYQGKLDERGYGDAGLRTVGNLATTVPLTYGLRLPLRTVPGQVAESTVSGAMLGAASPVTEGDYAAQKQQDIKLGAAVGAATPVVMRAAARVVSPRTSENVQLLRDEGVNLTPGQALGGAWQRTEEALTSVPIVGDAIKRGQRKAIEDMNRAVANRALREIGVAAPRGIRGRELTSYVDEQLGKAYGDLLPKLNNIRADDAFLDDITTLSRMADQYGEGLAKQFNAILDHQVFNKFTPAGTMSGEQMKRVDSALGHFARQQRKSDDFDKRQFGDAIASVQLSLRNLVTRSHPERAAELSAIDRGYANYVRMRHASGMQGAQEGVFSGAQLSSAVRAQDASVGKGNFARGRAPMQDLSDAAKDVLGTKVPDSGTPLRAATLGAGWLGTAAIKPEVAVAMTAAPIAYSEPGKRVLNALLSQRPGWANSLAEMMRGGVPATTPLPFYATEQAAQR